MTINLAPADGRPWWSDARSWALIGLAQVVGSRAWAYRPGTPQNQLPIGLADIADVIPVWVWGILWALNTVGLAVVALRRLPVARWMTFLVVPPVAWGVLYLIGGLVKESERSVAAAWLFLAVSLVIAACIIMRPATSALLDEQVQVPDGEPPLP